MWHTDPLLLDLFFKIPRRQVLAMPCWLGPIRPKQLVMVVWHLPLPVWYVCAHAYGESHHSSQLVAWCNVIPSCSTLVKCLSFCYLVWKTKTNYYKRYFETNIGNIKKSWKRVNSILCRTLPTTEINRIDIGDNWNTTPLEISNVLNYHLNSHWA